VRSEEDASRRPDDVDEAAVARSVPCGDDCSGDQQHRREQDLRFDVVHPAPTFKPMFPATSSDFVRRFIVTSFVSTRTTMDRYRKVPHVLETFASASHRYLGKSPKFDSDVSQRADLLHACFSD
jgi:hypothetical protein